MSERSVVFIKKSRKHFRKAVDYDDDVSDTIDIKKKIIEAKILQKSRQRPRGVNVVDLPLSNNVLSTNTMDPLKQYTDNVINIQQTQRTNKEEMDSEFGTRFSAATNRRDEDDQMQKYIEQELSKRLNSNRKADSDGQCGRKLYSAEDAALLSVPKYLIEPSSNCNKSEEMLSNQILNGIPEVDLGVDVKIRNIEETEEAKRKLFNLQNRQLSSKFLPSFVPKNIAVNFIELNKKHQGGGVGKVVSSLKTQKASDKLIYDKFRKFHNY